ncbi:CBS domain-containing protein [Bacillus sp. JCM 19034]|uniref:CBS domain-containing protein n=1 Tax=Bacillus sp. JCM 19034 TaxID=1481928 RepID=UPI000782A7FC|nr:CBS domain-containing protein [Bacillus sp. JCM 19034]
MEVIVSHVNLDFDGLACMLAAKKLYPNATVALTDKQQATVKSYLAIYRDKLSFKNYEQITWESVSTLIVVDVSSLERTGIPINRLPHQKEVIIYDHHQPKDHDYQKGTKIIKHYGAAITILIEYIREKEMTISAFEATLFGLGLYTDTGNFTFLQTQAADLQAAAFLLNNGMDISLIERFSETGFTTVEIQLLQTLLLSGNELEKDGLRLFITSHELDDYQSGLAVITRKLLEMTHTDGVITIVKMKKHVYIVVRSSSERIDFQFMLKELGGGGHSQAGSATIKNGSLDLALESVHSLVHTIFQKPITAADIMSTPIKFVLPETTIQSTLDQMFQFGHTGFPVLNENEQLVGVISRRDVDKAIHHGLGHAPVKAYMSTKIVTLPKEASLETIQAVMMKHNIGRIPILDGQAVVGIISRTDLIEQLHQSLPIEIDKKQLTQKTMLHRLNNGLTPSVLQLLKKIGQLADQYHYPAFLVGGIVRDLILETQNEDIDIVIEGNAISFALQLEQTYGGTVKSHEEFGTATWTTKDGFKIDLVTCRTEYYQNPGVLPSVKASNIREDLSRRDFSINALAIQLNKEKFGYLIDYYQGMDDLDQKVIRVLHSLSFVEDPTRIFRAVRFVLRLNYQLSTQTRKLALDAAHMVKRISPQRLIRELKLFMQEGQLYNGMIQLNDLNVWQELFQARITAKRTQIIRSLTELDIKEIFPYLLIFLEGHNEGMIRKYALQQRTSK